MKRENAMTAQTIAKPSSVAARKRIRLAGTVAARLDAFARERITSGYARDVICKEAEDAFRNKLDDASGVHGIWQGEFWGKWIIGAIRYCEYSGDAGLKEFIRKSVHTLIGMQEPSGYLGTYRDPMNVFPADPVRTQAVLGWSTDWNWNIWCRKYTLWALLEAYRLLKEPEVLSSADKLASHLIRSLHEHKIRLGATGTFAGIPSGSILKPMVLLYRATGKTEFLAFAREIAADWKRPDGLCPNLIANALSGKPVHEWYPEPKNWAKAYEMMSCFDGIIELYRVTGEPELLESAVRFHALLKASELNPLFSVGFNDIFNHAASQITAISEPCDVIHWMRLCGELFRETDDKKYLDDFEPAFYNPFLAAVCRDGKWGARGVRSHCRHLYVHEQAGMKHNHCCVDNIPRGFLNFAELAATVRGNTVSVNFYSAFDATLTLPDGGKITLAVSGDYPADGPVRIEWEAEPVAGAKLRLRIPGWTKKAVLESGAEFCKTGSDWFELPLKPGKSALTLNFERELEVREHRAPANVPKWYRERWGAPDIDDLFRTERGSTLVYGPLLLARSKFLGNSEEEMFRPPLSAGFTCKLHRTESDAVAYAFDAEINADDKVFHTKVCDYASAGNMMTGERKLFSIFF